MTALFATAPALPLHSAGKYVAAAYIVFLALVLIYVAIMAVRLGRHGRDVQALAEELRQRDELEAERAREAETVA